MKAVGQRVGDSLLSAAPQKIVAVWKNKWDVQHKTPDVDFLDSWQSSE
jgi:hypothetical protein